MIDVMEKVIDLQKTLDNFIKNAGIEYNKAVNLQIANQLAIAEMKREFEEAEAKRKQEREEAEAKRKIEREEAEAKRKQEREEAEAKRKQEREEAEAKRKQEREEAEAKEAAMEAKRKQEREEAEAKRKIEREEDDKRRKKEFEEEIRKSNTELNKKIGEQANRLGRIVEDLVLPSMPRVIIEKFGFELERFFINYKGKDNGRYKEYDAVGVYKDLVFICSSKSLLREKNIAEFQSDLAEFRYWFPEYKDKKLIGIFAAVTLPENMIPLCEKEGFLVMGIGSEIMELKNTEGFIPREY